MIFLSKDANPALVKYLKEKGYEISFVSRRGNVDAAIENHPDVYLCAFGINGDDPVYEGDASLLGPVYPADVKYNVAVAGNRIICCRKYVSEDLLKKAGNYIEEKYGCPPELIDVPQGYTKCSLSVVSENAFLTEDAGICRKLTQHGLSCLLLGTHGVSLPGYSYGFIGGCCGLVGGELLFNGDVSLHPEFERIKAFAAAAGRKMKWFDGPLTDIGSILCGNRIIL